MGGCWAKDTAGRGWKPCGSNVVASEESRMVRASAQWLMETGFEGNVGRVG